MYGSINHLHYNLDTLDPELKTLAESHKLAGPCFIGQGLTRQVGSDCYGRYIVDKKLIKNKLIFGIAEAKSVMHGDWYEGDMDCSIDMTTAIPTMWITKYGKNWYFCDSNGKRRTGSKCHYDWNGAHAYQDPSF